MSDLDNLNSSLINDNVVNNNVVNNSQTTPTIMPSISSMQPYNENFDHTVSKLLAGNIIDEFCYPVLMNWLTDENNLMEVQQYFARINKQVLFTQDKQGAYLGYFDIKGKQQSKAIQKNFESIAVKLFPIVLWLRLARGAVDSDHPLQAGEKLTLSELISSIENSKQLENQLNEITNKNGKNSQGVKKQLNLLLDSLEKEGYLTPINEQRIIYIATAKWSVLYDQLEYLAEYYAINQQEDESENKDDGYQQSLTI